MPSQSQIRQEITNKIVAALEQNILPWRRPWATSGRHRNAVSGRAYSGVNPWLLELHAMRFGFTSRRYATFNQWKTQGCTVKQRPQDVKPGQWGCQIVFAKKVNKKAADVESGEEKDQSFFLLRTFTVFNADQVDGYATVESVQSNQPLDFAPADELIEATGAQLCFGGDSAFYRRPSPSDSWPNHTEGDFVQVPHKAEFNPPGSYYETVLHELSHWSEVRLNWTGSYSMGELIAEMSSCFLAQELGVPQGETFENHAAYVRSWLSAMKDDSRFIFQASSQSSRVADFLLAFVKQPQAV